MRASSFAVVAQLSADEQQQLLESGDDPERLWAAWAIAQRVGRDAVPLLTSLESSEAPEGLRRQLLVVLAGMGERQLLRAIAEAEPGPAVRATAAMLYLRTAPDPRDSEAVAFALTQLRTAPAEVRRVVLDEQEAGHASIPAPELFVTLQDPDPSTRIACARCLLAAPSGNVHPSAVRAVIDAFADETDTDVRREFLARLPRSAVAELLETVANRDASRLVEVLNAAMGQFGDLTWSHVAKIAHPATLSVARMILASGIRPEPPHGMAWLCDALRIASTVHSVPAEEVAWRALFVIQPLLTEDTVKSLLPADRSLLRLTFEEALAEHVARIDDYGPDSDDGDYVEELRRFVQVLS